MFKSTEDVMNIFPVFTLLEKKINIKKKIQIHTFTTLVKKASLFIQISHLES